MNYNEVLIPLMTELDEPFSEIYVAFQSSVKTLIPIRNLIPCEKTESVVYYVVWSYK